VLDFFEGTVLIGNEPWSVLDGGMYPWARGDHEIGPLGQVTSWYDRQYGFSRKTGLQNCCSFTSIITGLCAIDGAPRDLLHGSPPRVVTDTDEETDVEVKLDTGFTDDVHPGTPETPQTVADSLVPLRRPRKAASGSKQARRTERAERERLTLVALQQGRETRHGDDPRVK
jgi:hypothetical protein